VSPTLTTQEAAAVARATRHAVAAEAIEALAAQVDAACFAPRPPTDADASRTRGFEASARRQVLSNLALGQRLLVTLDPRPLWWHRSPCTCHLLDLVRHVRLKAAITMR
jgi:hypothetical protein